MSEREGVRVEEGVGVGVKVGDGVTAGVSEPVGVSDFDRLWESEREEETLGETPGESVRAGLKVRVAVVV